MGEKNLNFDKICRACLSENDLKSIFHQSSKDGLTFAEKIMACASVQVAKGDGYPANICKSCSNQVNEFYAFKQKCEKTYNFLQLHKYEVKRENGGNNDNDNIYLLEGIKDDEVLPIKFETNNISHILNENDDENFFSLFGDDDNRDIIKTESENSDQNDNSSLKDTKTDISFRSKKKYNNHFGNQKRAKRVPCPTCNKEFSVNHIYRHMRVHTQEKPFTCHICGKSFKTGFNRDRHIKTHTGERPFQCNTCGKGFIQAVTLEAHIRVHTGETPFMCSYCGKAFKQSRLCRLHVQRRHTHPKAPTVRKKRTDNQKPRIRRPRTENVERRYICDICNRRFISRPVLQTHKMQHGEKSFLCSECGKMFISQVALKIHGIVHSGTKQYTCHICKKAFAYSSSLKTHLTRHTGEKRFSCHLCGNKFLQSAHLKTHLKLHEGIKPFKCSVCGKDFSLKGNLTVHMRIHTGETPYKCPVCGKGFYDSSSMRKHHQSHVEKITKLD